MVVTLAANLSSELLIDELPSVSALTAPKDIPDTFVKLRKWVETIHSQGKLTHAAVDLTLEHRLAILKFLEREATGGIRRKLAKKSLDVLNNEGTWTIANIGRSASLEIDNVPSTRAESVKVQPSRTNQTGVSAESVRKEIVIRCQPDELHDDGVQIELPSCGTLLDRGFHDDDPQEDFDLIRRWVQSKKRQKVLAEAWAPLSKEYRAEIKEFLNYFGGQRPFFREQVREVLKWINAVDTSPSKAMQAQLDDTDTNALLNVQPATDEAEDGEEFANLSQWILSFSDADLAAAGVGLPAAARRGIFELLLRACRRQRSHAEARKVLSKLLRSETWSRGGFLDTAALHKILDKSIETHALEVATPALSASPTTHCMSFLRGGA